MRVAVAVEIDTEQREDRDEQPEPRPQWDVEVDEFGRIRFGGSEQGAEHRGSAFRVHRRHRATLPAGWLPQDAAATSQAVTMTTNPRTIASAVTVDRTAWWRAALFGSCSRAGNSRKWL